MKKEGPERRKSRRVAMRIPARVQGRDPNGTTWEEMASCDDISAGGVALVLKRPIRIGQVLHLALPLPQRFRKYNLTDASYLVYGLVRGRRKGNKVGILFLGKRPPRGTESLPTELFLLPGDPKPLAADKHGFEVLLRLEAEQAPGGVAQEERSIAQNVGERTADARTMSLPVFKGVTITVEEVGGEFKTRAEVRNVAIGKDGQPLLSLLFIDEPVPERLLPPVGQGEGSGAS
jgi:hypothetical protein